MPTTRTPPSRKGTGPLRAIVALNLDRDRCARELYEPRAPHWPGCAGPVTLADELRFRCPHCGEPMVQEIASEISHDVAAQLLADLEERRRQLYEEPNDYDR